MRPLPTPPAPAVPVRRNDLPFLIAVVLWLLLTAMIRPLAVPDEGRYADVARWMLVAQDWLTPRLNGLPFFHKPPLLYWIDASLFSVFGVSPQVARIAPALAASACVLGLFWFLRRHFGSAMARLSSLILVTSLLFFGGAGYVDHDMLVGSGITLGIICFADGVLTGAARSYILGYLFCGLAFMSKGMIGLALPGLVLLPWFIGFGRWRRQTGQVLNPVGLLVLVAVVLPWFVLEQRNYPNFFHYFFIDQQFNRYLDATFNNKQPWWFYVAGVLVSFMPWLFLAPLKGLWQRWVDYFGKELAVLLLWWPVAIIGFFSIPVSKLIGYVIPAVAPVAILLAGALQRVELGPLRRLAAPLFLLVTGSGLLIASLKQLDQITPAQSSQLTVIAGVMLVSAVLLLLLVSGRRMHWLLGAALASALWCLAPILAFTIADHKNNSHDLAISRYLTPDTELVFYGRYFYDIPFLLDWPKAVAVVQDWDHVTGDSWDKELIDGKPFDAVAAQKLWNEARFNTALHSGQRLLVLAPLNIGTPAALQGQQPVYTGRNFNAFLIARH